VRLRDLRPKCRRLWSAPQRRDLLRGRVVATGAGEGSGAGLLKAVVINVQAAISNARAFASEVIARLRLGVTQAETREVVG